MSYLNSTADFYILTVVVKGTAGKFAIFFLFFIQSFGNSHIVCEIELGNKFC